MQPRYTAALAGLAATAAIAVPAVAQARGGSDDPVNHDQRSHEVEHAGRLDRPDTDGREHQGARDDGRHHDGRHHDARDNDDGPDLD